jgi:alpha-tubulin suppressor-like RCC1 family protein
MGSLDIQRSDAPWGHEPTFALGRALAAGSAHSAALTTDGHVVVWGYVYQGPIDPPPGLDQVIGLAAGDSHAVALASDFRGERGES